MMKRYALFLIVSSLLVLAAGTVLADTDYRCLNKCVNNSGKRQDCLKECAYESTTPPVPVARGSALNNPNKQFDVPVPALKTVIPPNSAEKEKASKDYKCQQACLREGMQYGFCEQRCVKKQKTYNN